MAGGSLTVVAGNYAQAPAIAKRILCWMAVGNRAKLRTERGNTISFIVPEEAFGAGSLVLKRGGTDLVAGYVAGSNISVSAGNGAAIEQDANTCPASTTQPTTTGASFATNVGGNPLAVTLTYANAVGAGTVNINWGDGTSTLGAAESGSSNHTYTIAPAVYKITITDASVATDIATLYVQVP